MTETNAMSVDKEEKKTVTVSWKKLTDGIGLVFAGTSVFPFVSSAVGES